MKKKLAILLASALCLGLLASCGGNNGTVSNGGASSGNSDASSNGSGNTPAADPVVIQIGFENTTEEPIGQAVQKWADLLEEQSGTLPEK